MRSRGVGLFALALAVTGTLASCGESSSSVPDSSVLAPQTLQAGEVEVIITPTRLDDEGATFTIVLDTHSADLSVDLTTAAILDVGGTKWTVEGWVGDGLGGHHREGELSFGAEGPAKGTASLKIAGLPEPVVAAWELDGG